MVKDGTAEYLPEAFVEFGMVHAHIAGQSHKARWMGHIAKEKFFGVMKALDIGIAKTKSRC
ncbi:hypothetical protein DSCO28_59840 [Desulfosarcina ovata subsp. sediminis]|uniref:Uncharacterized protein n=1 Tax=Desulfosarcina ovata subsp. sediminis TaxID=885957 RepID=A0A5K7ZYV6_9BACT|nr:hypothetical protein [Desulfosarcina ovata]BBO85418.1 hypothetical protein DSCO28_59840 [Desulfosarcina ovata subsp. sediminis]